MNFRRIHQALLAANIGLLGLCAGFGASDVAGGHWTAAGFAAGSAVINGLAGRINYNRSRRPPEPQHHPDYAKIRALEIELGLRPPDPMPEKPAVVPAATPYCRGCGSVNAMAHQPWCLRVPSPPAAPPAAPPGPVYTMNDYLDSLDRSGWTPPPPGTYR